MATTNAPFFREIIDKTNAIGSSRVQGNTEEEIRSSVLHILQQQRERINKVNVRTKAHKTR